MLVVATTAVHFEEREIEKNGDLRGGLVNERELVIDSESISQTTAKNMIDDVGSGCDERRAGWWRRRRREGKTVVVAKLPARQQKISLGHGNTLGHGAY